MLNREDIIDASSKYHHQSKTNKQTNKRIVTIVKKKNVGVRAEDTTGSILVNFY